MRRAHVDIRHHKLSDDVDCGNAIIAFVLHTRMNDVGRGIPSSPLDCTQGQITSGVERHHIYAKIEKIGQRRVWHVIITTGKHIQSIDVGRGMPSRPL